MTQPDASFRLASQTPEDPAPALTAVTAKGRLDGLLFELTLRQHYRNTHNRPLEVVYTFPLPAAATLLGFASELNGDRTDSQVMATPRAERTYEAALSEGDAPVMLQAGPDGLYTANIGKLAPGDEIVLEIRLAQLLVFEQGRLRLWLPTTVAPRYGNALATGLQPQQVPQTDLGVEYALSFDLRVGPALAGASIECPTHRFIVQTLDDGAVHCSLAPGASLDRDVVLIVTPREPRPSLMMRAQDERDPTAPVVVLAALQPPALPPRESIALKLLIDCSGSMAGDSIDSARRALRGVIADLQPIDRISLQRFGSAVQTVIEPTDVKPQTMRYLMPLIDGMQADLGGTEMQTALAATLEQAMQTPDGQAADVLLITDGAFWQTSKVIETARRSGQRVFVIGVGASVAANPLRMLAQETAGACECATPGEALEQAARRMLRRIRQPSCTTARVDWGTQPAWITTVTPNVFGGDTVLALAGFTRAPQPGRIRLVSTAADGNVVELARLEAEAPCHGDTLARLAAARRAASSTRTAAKDLALRYQLVGPQTCAVLVHARADGQKVLADPLVHRVPSMMAAGSGGLGSVELSGRLHEMARYMMNMPLYLASPDAAGFGGLGREAFTDVFGSIPPGDFEAAEAGVSSRRVRPVSPTPLTDAARAIGAHLNRRGHLSILGTLQAVRAVHLLVWGVWAETQRHLPDTHLALVVMAHWLNSRKGGLADPELERQLIDTLSLIDPAVLAQIVALFEDRLGRLADQESRVSPEVQPQR